MPVHSSATIAFMEDKIKHFKSLPGEGAADAAFWLEWALNRMLQENNDALVVMSYELGLADQ
jgi:hypothetical protein